MTFKAVKFGMHIGGDSLYLALFIDLFARPF
jgi:hypothetical protein